VRRREVGAFGSYDIELHEEVAKDLAAVPRNMSVRVLDAIEQRLANHPEEPGERLRKSLRGYWKLRVGDYRVVYEIVGRKVRVYGVIHRREVYQQIARRFG
jgi:mRNA interferase RelE/StbE